MAGAAPLLPGTDAGTEAGDAAELPEDVEEQQRIVAELEGLLGRAFAARATPHFILVYDTDDRFAQQRGVLLERTHRLYYEHFHKAGLSPRPLERRLVCLLFSDFEGYSRYAEATDKAMGWAGGYYSSRTNRIAFYHDRTSPNYGEVTTRIEQLDAAIAEAEAGIEASRKRRDTQSIAGGRNRLSLLWKQRRFLSNRLEAVAAGANDAKTTHEAVHQLAFNSELQNIQVAYPFWLSEGLATSFETVDAAGAERFGPYHDNPSRRGPLIEAHMHGRLLPLESFAVMTGLPDDFSHQQAIDAYSQSWGLFQFLFRKRQEQLRAYLTALAIGPQGLRGPGPMREDFERAFGPIAKVEREFSAYIRAMR